MSDFTFPLVINDDLKLSIKINVSIKHNKKLIRCYAYLTEGVPIIEVVFSIIAISKLDEKDTDIYAYLEKMNSKNRREYLFIHRFYNLSGCSEKYRGLGKICIKECLKYCGELYCYDIVNAPVILECSGSIPKANREIQIFSKLEILDFFKKYDIVNKKDFEDYLSDNKITNRDLENQSKEELLKNFSNLIVDYEENQELSEYYSRNFKLKILDDFNIYYKTMGCILSDFIK